MEMRISCFHILGKTTCLVFAGAGDLAVVLGACVQVVVVGCQPGLPQLLCLVWRQHAQRGAHLAKARRLQIAICAFDSPEIHRCVKGSLLSTMPMCLASHTASVLPIPSAAPRVQCLRSIHAQG